MNLLRDKPLKVLALYLLVILSMVFLAEYLIIRNALLHLTAAEQQIDYVRSVQVQNQQIALEVERLTQASTGPVAELGARLDNQDFLLKTLKEGGRMEHSDVFLDRLPRLPLITFVNLEASWNVYKKGIRELINNTVSQSAQPSTSVADSTRDSTEAKSSLNTGPLDNAQSFDVAKINLTSQWLSLSNWYDKLITDLDSDVAGKQRGVLNWFLLIVLVNIGALVMIYYFFHTRVLNTLKTVEANTSRSDFSKDVARNEIGDLATRVNDTIEDLRDATEFVISIGEGNLDLDYKSLDAGYERGKNKLADSLIEMQSKLKTLNEEEKKRQWVNEGLTRFVDILRSSNDNLGKLGDKIIAALVQYTNSNQGAIYTLNDDDQNNKHLELISLFAFDIKKHDQQKIKLGQGILGQTFLEKETTYLTDLPESYIRITSGLGDAAPKSVLMVPLKVDTQTYGILELASFHAYQPHEISFVEKLGESIAATLASVKSTQKNRQLIEQFQQQTEEMRAQEEEMRQNMEELQATQEEIARKEKNYVSRIKELESQPATGTSLKELESIKFEADKKAREYELRISDLSRQVTQQSGTGGDWDVATNVERALRINMEALQITQEELDKKNMKRS
ncbi:MAG TPA: GAF domain-containing protein [Chryseolinea sp.]|nr:GAF domain-containing protein [Chryseolinea sp.]